MQKAIAVYEDDDSPQRPGNLLRARRLKQQLADMTPPEKADKPEKDKADNDKTTSDKSTEEKATKEKAGTDKPPK